MFHAVGLNVIDAIEMRRDRLEKSTIVERSKELAMAESGGFVSWS